MVTAAHKTQAATPSLNPRGETRPFPSHATASRRIVLWKYTVTTIAITSSTNFTSNMPSARYWAGLVIHSVRPLATWHTTAIQTSGINLFSAEYGIAWNDPSSRRPMMNVRPITVAVPNAWTVRATGQPQDWSTHSA